MRAVEKISSVDTFLLKSRQAYRGRRRLGSATALVNSLAMDIASNVRVQFVEAILDPGYPG